MLTRLSIRNVVLIEALDLDFSGGLGVLTGETGAGKSILLDALGLVLGNRADGSLIRAGAEKASVTATFEFAHMPPAVAELLEDSGIELEPGEAVILRRNLASDGRNKATVNDQPVGVALLRQLGDLLVELHGQHDDRGLVNPRGHRKLLDRFAEIDSAALERNWAHWHEARARLDEARHEVDQIREDQDMLLAHLTELTEIAPQAGEEARLAEARAAMQKGERLTEDLDELRALWDGSDSPLAILRSAARRLDRIAPEHELLAEALAGLDRAIIEAGEAEDKLSHAAQALIHDPEELDQAETRLFELRALARKHRCEVDQLPEKMREMRTALDAIEGGEAQLDALEAAEREAGDAFRVLAAKVHEARISGAKKLDKMVAQELAPLKLDSAKFLTAIEKLPEERWGAHGMDGVEFMISTNPGADFAPLTKIASGGELSRFILALKVALAEQGGAVTMIFDEIDRGVGGAVASAIGERLGRLADGGQVLVVTHSPQVAARGGAHYVIAKSSEGTVTRTSVARLEAAQRQEEIARMLSGTATTDEARAQAEKLMEGV
ncbi:DNA repair protein RecN [Altererythrobacter sp. MF3-039]|uniref:DNA repair protein RecN n=1 Tax=Altererythrobacter sp. MF3-039 TaxID=3252901 RepID=UPI00390C9404